MIAIGRLLRHIPLIRRPFYQRDSAIAECEQLRERVILTSAERDALVRRVTDLDTNLQDLRTELCALQAQYTLSMLRPMDVIGHGFVRKGRIFDGGYVMLDYGLEHANVYSFGIGNDVSWDLDMAALGCNVFQYDHTIANLPTHHPNFHYFHHGIAQQHEFNGLMRTLPDLIEQNGHLHRNDLILKMDIEGTEWDVLRTLPARTLEQFSQIVVELHELVTVKKPDQFPRVCTGLHALNRGHQAVHVHANNWGELVNIGSVTLPDVLEVTYVRRADHHFAPCLRNFPTPLDKPCNPDMPDYFLGPLGVIRDPTFIPMQT